MAHVVVLTGAGMSAESGIPTFRDSNGLWENHKVEDVATPMGWFNNPELVWRFYQERRRDVQNVQPNAAHIALAEFEDRLMQAGHEFTLITQNIDGLHGEAGSKNVIEMHGALRRLICQKCKHIKEGYDYLDLEFLVCDGCGWARMRPDVVWFDEMPHHPEKYHAAVNNSTHYASIGTSGQVHPAAGFIYAAAKKTPPSRLYFVNLEPPPITMVAMGADIFTAPATQAVPVMCERIESSINRKKSP